MTRRVPAGERDAIDEAARILGAGGLVAFPTETVYGLGADATNGAAIAKLYAAKGRPAFNPLIAHVLDGGPAAVGVESTIVACLDDGPTLLRSGGVPRNAIERALGRAVNAAPQPGPRNDDEVVLAPGMLASHYAPRARLRLDATEVKPGEALLAFGPDPAGSGRVLNLSPRGDLIEAAANLFAHLRALDHEGGAIAVMPIPREGLGEAIND